MRLLDIGLFPLRAGYSSYNLWWIIWHWGRFLFLPGLAHNLLTEPGHYLWLHIFFFMGWLFSLFESFLCLIWWNKCKTLNSFTDLYADHRCEMKSLSVPVVCHSFCTLWCWGPTATAWHMPPIVLVLPICMLGTMLWRAHSHNVYFPANQMKLQTSEVVTSPVFAVLQHPFCWYLWLHKSVRPVHSGGVGTTA